MRTGISVSLAALISAAFFTSCQKEVDSNILNQFTEDSTYLTKEVSLDTTLPAGQDTAFIADYFYDSKKRLSGYDFTEIGSGGARFRYDYKLYYNGNDTLPVRISSIYNGGPDSMVTYLFYTGGFISRDSAFTYQSGIPGVITKKYYTGLGGDRYLLKQYDHDPGSGLTTLEDSTIYKRTVSGGNVTFYSDSTWSGMGTYYYMSRIQAAYDNKNSPYNKFPVWYFGYYEHLVSEVSLTGLNNMISYSYTSDYGPPFAESYTIAYTYNPDNYPLVARLTGNSDVNKAVYFYTKL